MRPFSFRFAARGLLALAAWAPSVIVQPAAAQQASAIAPGYTRVWILRQYEPSESLRTPVMYINGAPIGASQPGTIFYRDLPAGGHRVTVDSRPTGVGQPADLHLLPGNSVSLAIQSLSSSKRACG